MDSSQNSTFYYKHTAAHRLFKSIVFPALIILKVNFILGCTDIQPPINTPEGMIKLTDSTINNVIKYSDGYLLVHFSSYDPNCGYCSDSNPYIDEIMQIYKNNLKIARITWEPWSSYSTKSKSTTDQYWIRGIPMVILYKNGQEIWRGTGHTSENTNKIEELLKECCS